MGAENAAGRGKSQAVEHALRVAPGDADLRGEAEALRLVGKDAHDLLELIDLDSIELAVAVGGVDAVDAGGVQAADVLAKDPLVETVIVVKGRGDGGPDAAQVVARQALAHGWFCDH